MIYNEAKENDRNADIVFMPRYGDFPNWHRAGRLALLFTCSFFMQCGKWEAFCGISFLEESRLFYIGEAVCRE